MAIKCWRSAASHTFQERFPEALGLLCGLHILYCKLGKLVLSYGWPPGPDIGRAPFWLAEVTGKYGETVATADKTMCIRHAPTRDQGGLIAKFRSFPACHDTPLRRLSSIIHR